MTTPIIILILLVSPLTIVFIVSKIVSCELDIKKYATWGLGITFIFFSIGHFVKTEGMVQMLPSWMPLRHLIIYITGLVELSVGIALFYPKLQIIAVKAAIVIFIIFFPANIYSAINATGLGGHQWGPVYLFVRTPLQLILIGWAYFLCLKRNSINN